MKKSLSLAEVIKSKPVPKEIPGKRISHSQYTVYKSCQWQWYLRYVEKIKSFTSSMNTVFGTAMHEVFQKYLEVMWNESGAAADRLDSGGMLYERMYQIYKEEMVKNGNAHFSTPWEMNEFYNDGVAIIKWFKKNKAKYFSKKGIELLGIEIHIVQPVPGNPSVYFEGYIDITFKDNDLNKIFVYDFKTSKKGWSDKYEKKDADKIAQILWYKKFFSVQYEIPEDDIEVVYFILKRKIWEESEFPQKRVQVFRPAAGKGKVDDAMYRMETFVNECFTADGEFILDRHFEKNPGHSCNFCPFKNDLNLCDQRKG